MTDGGKPMLVTEVGNLRSSTGALMTLSPRVLKAGATRIYPQED